MADLEIRTAVADDVSAIVAMLADDPLGAQRESPDDLTPYLSALDRLSRDPNQHLVVAVREGRVVGTLQLTVIPGLSRRGATRSSSRAYASTPTSAAVVSAPSSSSGRSTESRRQDCQLVQLTSDATRTDAHRFYERLGFQASHVGFKLPL